jgi:hypothetical protein
LKRKIQIVAGCVVLLAACAWTVLWTCRWQRETALRQRISAFHEARRVFLQGPTEASSLWLDMQIIAESHALEEHLAHPLYPFLEPRGVYDRFWHLSGSTRERLAAAVAARRSFEASIGVTNSAGLGLMMEHYLQILLNEQKSGRPPDPAK